MTASSEWHLTKRHTSLFAIRCHLYRVIMFVQVLVADPKMVLFGGDDSVR
jgi:hypothetical protein